jgi:hypothetical protein
MIPAIPGFLESGMMPGIIRRCRRPLPSLFMKLTVRMLLHLGISRTVANEKRIETPTSH